MATVSELVDEMPRILRDFVESRDCTCDDDSWWCWYSMDENARNAEFKSFIRHELYIVNDWSETVELNTFEGYPEEILNDDDDDGTMPSNVDELRQSVVGHKIVKVEIIDKTYEHSDWRRSYGYTTITLDNGKTVILGNTSDCCAYTELDAFLLNPDLVDHIITGVGTTDGYERWHIYADYGDILELTVGWSPGNPFYYGYGFHIDVVDTDEIAN